MKTTREPNFQNVLDMLARRPTDRPVLFEFIINTGHIQRLAGESLPSLEGNTFAASGDCDRVLRVYLKAFLAGGYDFMPVPHWQLNSMVFRSDLRERDKSIGMSHGGIISDRETFEKYTWPDPETTDWDALERLKPQLPEGMKFLIFSPGGVLENLVDLLGYEDLCFMLAEDPELLHEIVDGIGSRLLRFYELALQHDLVGAALVNDDWGFKTQPFLAPMQMHEYIIPWHRRIAQAIHSTGRPALMHSCGELSMLWDDIIDDIKIDGKHSYEDTILPVEDAYEKYGSRIAILGGMDVDFLCRATPDAIYRRSKAMIERTQTRGGYALGSGNSIADYIPAENYDAMRRAALE